MFLSVREGQQKNTILSLWAGLCPGSMMTLVVVRVPGVRQNKKMISSERVKPEGGRALGGGQVVVLVCWSSGWASTGRRENGSTRNGGMSRGVGAADWRERVAGREKKRRKRGEGGPNGTASHDNWFGSKEKPEGVRKAKGRRGERVVLMSVKKKGRSGVGSEASACVMRDWEIFDIRLALWSVSGTVTGWAPPPARPSSMPSRLARVMELRGFARCYRLIGLDAPPCQTVGPSSDARPSKRREGGGRGGGRARGGHQGGVSARRCGPPEQRAGYVQVALTGTQANSSL